MTALEELVDPSRVISDLQTLHELSSDHAGAQRVAWTPQWENARNWLRGELDNAGIPSRIDPAGNLWAAPAHAHEPLVYVGSHLDSVPDGGRYDGALGVLSGLELVRVAARETRLEHAVGLVDFADEEGARFGCSLFGSSAVVGSLDARAVASLTDERGVRLDDVVAQHGVELATANDAAINLRQIWAYCELHIEQDSQLDSSGASVAAVSGASGIRRWQVAIHGESTHAGSISMADRRDPILAAAQTVTAIAEATRTCGGLATFGRWAVTPSIATAVPATVKLTIDLRHENEQSLATLAESTRQTVRTFVANHGCEAELVDQWRMAPVAFDAALTAAASEAAQWAGGSRRQLVSGRGHDAVILAQRVPVTMLFCPSVRGLSHNSKEHTEPGDIANSVRALARLVGQIAAGEITPAGRQNSLLPRAP